LGFWFHHYRKWGGGFVPPFGFAGRGFRCLGRGHQCGVQLDEGVERSPGRECKESEIRSVPKMSLKQKEKGKGLLGALSAKE